MTSVPGFLTKTFEIFSTPEYADCCGWGPHGDTIIIRKIEQFSKQILPKYFKHSNFQSFVRQLNMYDFHKTVQDPNHGEFQHQYFRHNQPELLVHIKRKANNRGVETMKKLTSKTVTQPSQPSQPPATESLGAKLVDKSSSSFIDNTFNEHQLNPDSLTKLLPEDLANETDSLFQELEQQKNMREEFEKKMEEKMSVMEGENQMLKRMFFESHQKNIMLQERMDKVLKTLYTVFVNGQGGKALTGRIPSLLLTDGQSYPMNNTPYRAILDGSVDTTSSNSCFDSYNNADSFLALNSSYAGKELGSVNRGTSFDYAAASVSAPLKYLPSFDGTYFPANHAISNGDVSPYTEDPLLRPEVYHSDRVTLLPETTSPISETKKSGSRGTKRLAKSQRPETTTANSFEPMIYLNTADNQASDILDPSHDSFDKRRKLGDDNIGSSKPNDSNNYNGHNETREFIDLLHRNQDTTLQRLDSLEQTIATLLEGIDDEDQDTLITESAPTGTYQIPPQQGVHEQTPYQSINDLQYSNLSSEAVQSSSNLYN